MRNPSFWIGTPRIAAFIPFVAFLIFCAASPPAFPQSASGPASYVLDADGAVEIALKNNLPLASERVDVGAKKRKADTAWNVFVPTVDVSGSLSRWNLEKSGIATVPNTSAPVGDTGLYGALAYPYEIPRWSAAGQLSVQLALSAALFEGMRNLRLDYEAGLISYEQARLRLERDVRKSYYSILLIKENIAVMEENLAAADRRAVQAQENYRSGLVPELTVLQARVAAENLRPSLEELRNGLDSSLAAFAMNLGLPRGVLLTLKPADPPDFVSLDADGLVAGAAANRVELRGLRKSLELLENVKKLTYYQLYTPTLTLGWTYDPAFQGDPMKDSWFDEDWKQSSGMFRATVSFRLNGLLPFTKDAQQKTETDESMEKLRNTIGQTARSTEAEIDSLVQKLDKSRRSVDALILNEALADRAYRLSEEAYRAGAKDLLEVQNAELELRKARLEVLKERFNYVTGLLDLEYAAGIPFGSLEGGKK